jgi:peptide/nickel transport system substrate-binding protein
VAARLTLACLLVAAVARGESRPGYGGKVVGSLLGQPTTPDPLLAASHAELSVVGLVYDGLYRVDAAGRVVPHLAEAAPTVVGLEARIPLRAGVRFHDGKTMKPADVVASLQRAQRAPTTEWALAPVANVAAEGQMLVLTLRRATPELAALLAVPQLVVTPGGRAPARGAIGSGPFQVRRTDAQKVELAAFPEHFAGRPYLDGVVLRWRDNADAEARAYEAGEADFSLRGAVGFAGHEPKYPTEVLEGPATILTYLAFGRAHADVTGDIEFRRAVSLALGRAAFRHLGSGERVVPALLPASPDLGGPTPAPEETAARVDAAHAALRKVRAPLPRALELLVDRTRPDDAEVAARIVASLDQLGVAVSYVALAPADLQRRAAAGQCDLWLGQLVAPAGDPTFEAAAAFAAGQDRFATVQMGVAPLSAASLALAFDAHLPIVPLYHRTVRVHARKIVYGLAFDGLGRLGLADAFVFAGLQP